jgi:glycosyltransferase involved in cell wall biosynthesis
MAKFLFYDNKIINVLLKDETPAGGAAVQAAAWIRGLIEEGQQVGVMTHLKNDTKNLKVEFNDIDILPLFDPQRGIRKIRWVYYRLPYIYKKIKEFNPDYIYIGIPGWFSLIMELMCRRLNIKMIQRISSDVYVDERYGYKSSKLKRYFQEKAYKMAMLVVCQNDYQYAKLSNKYRNINIIKLYNPYYFDFNGNTNIAHSMSKRCYIAWVGLFNYSKNLPRLYELAHALKDEKFIIAGVASTSLDQESMRYLDKLKTMINVEFTGFLERSNIIKLLSNAKYLLNTSHYEGFSNTFIEAMSVGTPVITSGSVNPDNIIDKFNLGLVYESTNHLKKMYFGISEEEYTTMSKNTIEYVNEYHHYRKVAKLLLNHLYEVRET